MTERLTPEAIAARISEINARLVAISIERGPLTLADLEGNAAAREAVERIELERVALVAELGKLETAQEPAQRRVETERQEQLAAHRVSLERQAMEIGEQNRAHVARAEELLVELAEVFRSIASGHSDFAALAGGIPANSAFHDFMSQLPLLVRDIVGRRSGLLHFSVLPDGSLLNGRPWNGKLTDHYPTGWYFVELLQRKAA